MHTGDGDGEVKDGSQGKLAMEEKDGGAWGVGRGGDKAPTAGSAGMATRPHASLACSCSVLCLALSFPLAFYTRSTYVRCTYSKGTNRSMFQ